VTGDERARGHNSNRRGDLLPDVIAVLSPVTSIYNGYFNGKFVESIQRNFGRTEHLRTCKEIIDAYFQVEFRAGIVSENVGHDPARGATRPTGFSPT